MVLTEKTCWMNDWRSLAAFRSDHRLSADGIRSKKSGRIARTVIYSGQPVTLSNTPRRHGVTCRQPSSRLRIDGRRRKPMGAVAAQSQASRWLVENGPRELEQLFRAIVIHPATPV